MANASGIVVASELYPASSVGTSAWPSAPPQVMDGVGGGGVGGPTYNGV